MIIFINGSINSGKSTIGQVLAKKLGYKFIEFDNIRSNIPEPRLEKAIPLVISQGIKLLNNISDSGQSAVAVYPISRRNYDTLVSKLMEKPLVITLAPNQNIALSDRGKRKLTDWERERIKYQYSIGIHTPDFGEIIDNSNLTIKETVQEVLEVIGSGLAN